MVEGKKAAKEALQQKVDLKRADLPLVGIITRLTHQKGIHLIKHAIWRALDRGSQVVLLGSAPDPRIQNDFVNLASQLHSTHHDRASLCLIYDEPLSHLVCTIFLHILGFYQLADLFMYVDFFYLFLYPCRYMLVLISF